MKGQKRIYIVSFGDSRKYRVEFSDDANVDNYHHTNPLAEIEKELRDYLEDEFPNESLAYYTTPKITEVNYADRAEYESYPELDRIEIEKIKATLKRDVEVRQADKRLNLDAPYSNIAS